MAGSEKLAVPDSSSQAKASIKAMQASLRSWLKYRRIMDEAASGTRTPPALFRMPTAKPLPASVIKSGLRKNRYDSEQELANNIHGLLVECGLDPATLPDSDVAMNPEAAVNLAEIAISGKCEGDLAAPQAQGLIWWALLIPVAGVVVIISAIIKNRADVAKEEERLRCIQSGQCTDSEFWIKAASIGVLGWLAWDKMGLREIAKGAQRRAGKF